MVSKSKQGVSQVGFKGWQEIEITVGSGPCGTVMPISEHGDITIVEAEASNNDTKYEGGQMERLWQTMATGDVFEWQLGQRDPNPSRFGAQGCTMGR